jgi:hypothetical protein
MRSNRIVILSGAKNPHTLSLRRTVAPFLPGHPACTPGFVIPTGGRDLLFRFWVEQRFSAAILGQTNLSFRAIIEMV